MSRESETWETTSSAITNVMGVSEKEKRTWDKKITIKEMVKTSPNLIKTLIQIQETHQAWVDRYK